MQSSKPLHIIGAVARTLLGITFLFSGFVKAVDPLGTTYKIEDYLNAFSGFFLHFVGMAEVFAVALIAFEFLLGCCLLLNIQTRITSWLSLLMMLFMTPLTLYIAIANPVSDCGCFGDAVVLSNWATFWKNIVLLALVCILLLTKRYIPGFFTCKVQWGLLGLSVVVLATIMLYSRLSLPFIDFRPYKIGNHIPTLMEYPEDAEPDVYETTFVYSRNGVEQEFTLSNYPKDDSTWTFVRQNTVLVKKGYEPPIHDFSITNEDFEDITYDLLDTDEPVTLAVMYDLNKTNRKQAARLNELYEQTLSGGGRFYALTGAGFDEIEQFRQETGATYPFCNTDPVTLKTIVRANPGIIVIQAGTIIDKYNLRNR